MYYKLNHRQYFEALKQGQLLGLKCGACGEITAPPKACCDNCAATDLEVLNLSGEGEIKSYTVIRVAPEGLKAPYIVAMVELAEGPWLMGNLVDFDPERASLELIGKKVTVGHKVVSEMNYTAGEGVTPTFTMVY
ncbi:MAG: Zn-ribbon domain-containing OB-fold protein [Bacillota bacterium]